MTSKEFAKLTKAPLCMVCHRCANALNNCSKSMEGTTNGKKIELKENVAYGPVKQDQKFIDLKANEAYEHVQH